MTCKNASFTWGYIKKQAFDQLKMALISAPTLFLPDPKKPFIVTTDALNLVIGAVLSQPDMHDELHPVTSKLQKLVNMEKNYPVHENEMLAIVHALKVW